MTQLDEFIEAARSLKGARWRHRGRKPWAVDCLGLLELSGKKAATADDGRWTTPNVYGREPWDDQLRAGLRQRFGDPLPPAQARAGDIALIRWRKEEPSHVAIVADHPDGGLSMIHAHNIAGVTEHRIAHPFDQNVIEVYRPWPATLSR